VALRAAAGFTKDGLAYNRYGRGGRSLVVLQGLLFENKPRTGPATRFLPGPYSFLEHDYTVYVVLRKRGMSPGYTLGDMADDYARMIRHEIGGPVDVIGVSTGGSIAQHLAADHPDVVRRLVLHSAAHTLSDRGKVLQLRVGELARRGRWGAAYDALFRFMILDRGGGTRAVKGAARMAALVAGMVAPPRDASDLVVTVLAEDKHAFRSRLAQIAAPTVVVAGERDPFYTPDLFRETAEGISGARLILYPGMGHPASGKRFSRDVTAFLNADGPGGS